MTSLGKNLEFLYCSFYSSRACGSKALGFPIPDVGAGDGEHNGLATKPPYLPEVPRDAMSGYARGWHKIMN
jgi:hypothetical protein